MPWVLTDDDFFLNRKARAVGPLGRELFHASLAYCNKQLNDGCFVAEDVQVVAALAQVEPSIADLLVSHDMWHPEGHDCAKCRAVGQVMPVPPGYIAVHEFLQRHRSREQVIAEREAAAERKRRSRDKSRRDSHEDVNGSHGVSSASLVQVQVPSDTSSRRPGNSTGEAQPRPDDDELSTTVPDEVWRHVADLKLAQQTNVKNPGPWKTSTARNARVELGHQAERWWSDYDVRPRDLAAWLVDGRVSPYAKRRQDAS